MKCPSHTCDGKMEKLGLSKYGQRYRCQKCGAKTIKNFK